MMIVSDPAQCIKQLKNERQVANCVIIVSCFPVQKLRTSVSVILLFSESSRDGSSLSDEVF